MSPISATMVKELREATGVGMMDCKKALVETDGDLEKAKDWLREKGYAKAANKAGRSTNEGGIAHYVHESGGVAKLGVLVEVNCESDFVAKTDDFKQLGRELAMQVAGISTTKYVRREDVPEDIVEREKNVYRGQMEGKPADMIEKILVGKLNKFYEEICLMDQVWIRDDKKKVSDLVTEAISKLGENITVARFARLQVGEQQQAASPDDN